MADAFTWGEGGQKLSSTDLKRRMAYSLMKEGTSTAPVQHWVQGVDRVVKALMGGWELSELDKAEKANQALQAKDDAILNGGGGIFGLGGTPSPTTTASVAPTAMDGDTGSALPASLNTTESGGNWQAQNSAVGAGGMTGHFGRAQFGQARLQEAAAAGAIPQGTTPQMFMKSPELQKAAENWHFGDIDQNIRANGFDRMIGQSINGVPITMGGMRAVAHLGGNRGLQRFIETGGRYNPADANGTSLMDYFTTHGGGMRTAQADMPAPGASPVQANAGAEGFFIPPGQSDLPIMREGGALPNFDPATGRWLRPSPSAPASSAIQPDLPQPSTAAPEGQPAPQPLNPVFMSEGADQPWMNSTFTPSASPREAIARALAKTQTLPPPRPADLAMPQADLPAPGAVQAMGQVPVSQPASQPSYGEIDPNSSDGGARIGMLASEEARLGLPSGAGIMSPSEGMKAVAAALMQSRAGRDPLSTASTPFQRVAAALMPATPPPAATAAPTQAANGMAPQTAWSSQSQTQAASPLANGPVPVPQAADPGTLQRQAQIGAAMRTLNNPNATAGSKLIAQQVIQQAFRGRELETVNRPDGSVWHVPKNGQGAPVQIFGPQNKPESPTGDMREYELYRQQERAAGREPGDFTTWSRGNKSAGATSVNIDTKGAGKFAEKANELQAKRYGEMVDSSDSARQMQGDLDMLEGMSKGIATGRGAEMRLGMAQFAKAWGFDDIASGLTGGKLGEMEAFSSMIDKLTPQMRQGMPGAASERDVPIFRNALPNMLKTPDGNSIVMGTLRAMNEYKMRAGDLAGQALRGEISQAEADKAIRSLESPFAKFKEYRVAQEKASQPQAGGAQTVPAGAPAKVGSKADFDALPSGSRFTAPDGSVRIKP